LQPVLSETDATLATPFGPVSLSRSYAQGSIGNPFTSPFGGRDWTHSLHSLLVVHKENLLGAPSNVCFSALCKYWSVLTPEGTKYVFRPCTREGREDCYAGEAHDNEPLEDIEVQRA